MLGTLLILVWVSVWFTPTPITFGHFLNNLIYYNHWQEMTQQSTPHPPQFHVRFTQQILIVPIYKDTSKVSLGIPGIYLHFPGISRHFPGFFCISRGFHATSRRFQAIPRGFHPIYWGLLCCLLLCIARKCSETHVP